MALSLPPIIKIKRGSGTPPTWGITMGITAGEFAYDKITRTLFLGITGGYTAYSYDGGVSGGLVPNNQNNVIPVGMQISNDAEFGAGANKNLRAGYSDYTVPTTAAVKDYIAFVKNNASAGITIFGGVGIGITHSDPLDPDVSVTITNTGVLKGFTGINIVGGLGDYVYASTAKSGLTLIASSGIQLIGNNANQSVQITNIGVTGIAGRTGNITNFNAIVSLSGYTTSISQSVNDSISAQYPIVTNKNPYSTDDGILNLTVISHGAPIGGICYGTNQQQFSNNSAYVPKLLEIKREQNGGHVTSIAEVPLDFANANNWPNFNEVVQDASLGYIRWPQSDKYGLTAIYEDTSGNYLRLQNQGITSIGILGQGSGLCGGAKLFGDNAISLGYCYLDNSIGISYTGLHYKTISASPISSSFDGIYAGGSANNASVSANVIGVGDTINFRPGVGIGVKALNGIFGANDKSLVIHNTGVHMLSAYDSNTLLGGTGFSGNVNIYAGTGIQLTRSDNNLTINSTSGGGGGAIVDIEADFNYNSGDPNYSTPYSSGGVTGLVDISGLNGLATSQPTSTKDGTIYIGLTSKISVPADKLLSGITGYGELKLPTSRLFPDDANRAFILPYVGLNDANDGLINDYTKLVTDQIRSGLTGVFAYGSELPSWNPNYTAFSTINTNISIPGKVMSLVSEAGQYYTTGYLPDQSTYGPISETAGKHAEIRLLGYPNAENMSSYIQEALVDAGVDTSTVCIGGDCIGLPPTLPVPNANTSPNYNYITNPEFLNNGDLVNTRPTIVMKGDVVAKNSVFVNNDIFLNGNIIDIKTGELYASPGGVNIPGGNLGLTGDLIVAKSIYVHGGTAFFNVDNLSTESGIIHIGGVSGANYSELYAPPVSDTGNASGDRGLLHTVFTPRPRSALYAGAAGTGTYVASAARTGFVGIDATDGRFKYFFTCTRQNTNGKIEVLGNRLGQAFFSDINYVGITANTAGGIKLRAITDPDGTQLATDPTVVTDIELSGKITFVGPSSPAVKPTVTIGDNSLLTTSTNSQLVADNGSKVYFDAPNGISFTVGSGLYHSATDQGNQQNILRIAWSPTNATEPNRIMGIRNFGTNGQSTIVDIGRYYNGTPISTGTQWQEPLQIGTNGFIEAPLQILYNKQLANGTVIDCGTY